MSEVSSRFSVKISKDTLLLVWTDNIDIHDMHAYAAQQLWINLA